MNWSLQQLLAGLHDEVERRLSIARQTFAHPGTKGDVSEAVWLEMFKTYLPERYKVASVHVVDSKGDVSDQIDVAIFDRQYTPFIFNFQGGTVIPAESVYAVFETKQTINGAHVKYAQDKISSVRGLYRTSLPVPYVEGTYKAKELPHIIGGLLAFESDWTPALGNALMDALKSNVGKGRIDIGCVAARGIFGCDADSCYTFIPEGKPATAFLLELIARLQESATVPRIDVRAYAQWLARPEA